GNRGECGFRGGTGATWAKRQGDGWIVVRASFLSPTELRVGVTLPVHKREQPEGFLVMTPRRTTVEHSKRVFNVEWPLFGELSRAPALKVPRAYDPEIVFGVATAGVIPGAVTAAILHR